MGQKLYYNFSSGSLPSDFTLLSSDPLFKNGRLGNGRSSATLVASFPTHSTEGYLRFQVYGNHKQNGFTGLRFRRQNGVGHWRVGIHASSQELRLQRVVDGGDTTTAGTFTIPSYSKGTTYSVAITYIGSVFKVFLNGDLENPVIDVDVSSEASGGVFDNDFYGATDAGLRVETYDSYIDSIGFGGEPPVIELTGDNPTEVVAGQAYVEQGYTALDDMLGDLSSDVVATVSESLDLSTEGLYENAVTYTLTNIFGIDATPVTRDVLVRPANYIPVLTLPENIIVASGASAEIIAEVEDLDVDDTFTYQWVQVSGAGIPLQSSTSDRIIFTSPVVDTATDFEFRCTVTDSAGATDTKNFILSVKPDTAAQRLSSKDHTINIQQSKIKLKLENALTGFTSNMVSLIDPDTGAKIVHDVHELEDGAVDITVDTLRGLKYTGSVWAGTDFPPSEGWLVAGASVGEVKCFANDMVRIYSNFLPDNAVKVGSMNGISGSFYSRLGAYCSLSSGKFYYHPQGKFDYLDPGETVTDYIDYETSDGQQLEIPVIVHASREVGANLAGTSSYITSAAFEAGKIYEVAVTVTGRSVGGVVPQFDGPTGATGKYSLVKNARDVWHIKCPEGATQLEIVKLDGFDGDIEQLHVREVFRPELPTEPRKLALRDKEGVPVVQAILSPLYRAVDGEAPDKVWENEELKYNSEFGIRDEDNTGKFSVIDTFSVGKRGAISLKGGTYCYVDNCDVKGGYTGSNEKYTVGFIFQDSGSKIMKTQTMVNCFVDIMHPSHRGDYNVGPNSDPIVLNSTSGSLGFIQQAYISNCWLTNGGDGIIDSKMVTFTNYVDAVNGNRTLRSHNGTVHVTANTTLARTSEFGNQCLIHMKARDSRVTLFNVWVINATGAEKTRLVDREDLDMSNVVAQDNGRSEALDLIHIAKTIPSMTDNVLFAWDVLEMQYRVTGDSEWLDLGTIEHDHAGAITWDLDALPSNTYDFRCRAMNGLNYSVYTQLDAQEVTHATA
ncbi:hypothetical protein vBAmePPT11V19_00014 [Alteromonas phage vB_AmeP_PT11-V19]|nr:hypothetical protein vBAmePPT11V19_00014 [Alteromonas phage vB_AmeP_PT11-V19]